MSKKYFLPAIIVVVSIIVVIGFSLPGSVFGQNDSSAAPKEGYANPAAVYCLDQGFEYEMVTTDTGVVGMCQFPDGTSCDEWDFLAGKCGTDHSYCAQQGLLSETRTDGSNPFSNEYAVCVSEEGAEVGSVSKLTSLEDKSIKVTDDEDPESMVAADGNQTFEMDEEYTEEDFDTVDAAALPVSFDWRSQPAGNYLTNIKNQGQCGSCWAFSAVGAAEAALNIANQTVGNNYDLSEQYLVSDCNSDTKYGYQNCKGGWKDKALTYIKKYSVADESCMAYVDGDFTTGCGLDDYGYCSSNCEFNYGIHCSDCVCGDRCYDWQSTSKTIQKVGKVAKSQKAIKTALIAKGPLAVSLRMNGYFDGNNVYRCAVDAPTNHAVDIVGFNDAGNYWIVRNSWGATWDGDGYFNVGYGECSIERYVYYATALSDGPSLNAPSGTISNTLPTYSWTEMPGMEKYRLEVYSGSSRKLGKVYYASSVCSAGTCSVAQPKALRTSAYTWKVKAYSNKKWTGWSSPETFIVATSGINSSFNTKADSYGWKSRVGAWKTVSSQYYRTLGVKNRTASMQYSPEQYANMIYQAGMYREGCAYCANRLIIRGDSTPVDRYGSWHSGYAFQYVNDGYFSVWAYNPSSPSTRPLKEWTYTAAINQGDWNTLKVVTNDGMMYFYINNTLVWSGYDASFTEGNVGIGMYRAAGTTGNVLLVDWANLTVSYDADEIQAAAEAAAETIDPSQFTVEGGDIDTSP